MPTTTNGNHNNNNHNHNKDDDDDDRQNGSQGGQWPPSVLRHRTSETTTTTTNNNNNNNNDDSAATVKRRRSSSNRGIVRFAATTTTTSTTATTAAEDDDDDAAHKGLPYNNKKRKQPQRMPLPLPSRRNRSRGTHDRRGAEDSDDDEDEDPVEDEWNHLETTGNDDDDVDDDRSGGIIPTDRALREAQRVRRLLRQRIGGGAAGAAIAFDDDNENENDAMEEDLAHHRERDYDGAEEEEDDDDDDDDDHFKRRNDNGGVPITPFNMTEEETDGTGYFDGDTYVFRHGGGSGNKNDDEPDAWVDGLDGDQDDADPDGNKRMPITSISHRSSAATNNNDLDQWTDQELYARMLPLVSDTETISEAIIRYGLLLPSRGAQHTQRKKRPRQHGGAVAATAAEQPQDDDNNNDSADNETRSELARAALRDLTEAASALLLRGKVDVYQHTRRDLIRKLPTTAAATGESGGEGKSASTLVPSASPNAAIDKDTASAVKWEYMGSGDGLVHGPFTTSDMLQWTQAGYFVGTSAVQVRTVREDKSNNSHTTLTSPTLQDDLLNDLLDDDEDEAEREGENGKGSAPPSPPLVVRGDWQMSDQVDFARFL